MNRNNRVLAQIDEALQRLAEYRRQELFQAESISLQLEWCRGMLRGDEMPDPPGPLAMGIQATREFDMWGNEPDLARMINEIEREVVQAGLIGRA